MTNKQIIDGVDVSGCEWSGQIDLDINIICNSNSPKKCSSYCKDNHNCYYKQLALKEGIIKRLKEKHNRMCKSCPQTISCDECSNNTTLKILNGEIV